MKAKFIWVIGSLTAASVFALPSGGEFEIVKNTIDSGGGVSTGGEFSVSGTIGQPDAYQHFAAGGEFALSGGYWPSTNVLIFKNGFENN